MTNLHHCATSRLDQPPRNVGVWTLILFNMLAGLPGAILLVFIVRYDDPADRIVQGLVALVLLVIQLVICMLSLFFDRERWQITAFSLAIQFANLLLVSVMPPCAGC